MITFRKKNFSDDYMLGTNSNDGIMGKIYRSYENEVKTGARTKRAVRKGFNYITGNYE